MVGCSEGHRSRRTAGRSSPDNRFSYSSPATRWPIGQSAGAKPPLPVLPMWHSWRSFSESGSALPARANVAIDRPDADRTGALAAHDLDRSFRGLSLLDSGLIPQVPFPQFLFTSLGYQQYRAVRRALSFRIYLPGVSLFLLL